MIKKRRLKRLRKRKRYWVRDLYMRRAESGAYTTLFRDLNDDREMYFRYLRMSPDKFSHPLGLVQNKITKQDTKFRKAIKAEEKLA